MWPTLVVWLHTTKMESIEKTSSYYCIGRAEYCLQTWNCFVLLSNRKGELCRKVRIVNYLRVLLGGVPNASIKRREKYFGSLNPTS